MSEPANLTPMLSQYLHIKRQYPDAILFYRMGDFYEMFFDDAVTAAPLLEVQLTSRDRNAANPIPMCGVPHHAVTGYLQKLVAKGYKVALCEQMEDPATAKGIVRRDVVRVVTPALIGDPSLVSDDQRNVLVSIFERDDGTLDLATLDLLSGDVRWGALTRTEALTDLFLEWLPKEVLVPQRIAERKWMLDLKRLFPTLMITQRDAYFWAQDERPSHSALLKYVAETQRMESLPYLSAPRPLFEAASMQLDATTLASLEVLRRPGHTTTTLFDVIDGTLTPMGRRRLKDWLARPLLDLAAIRERHDAVAELVEDAALADGLREPLGHIRDLERLTTKAALGLANPRDLGSLRAMLERLPAVRKALRSAKSKLLKRHGDKLETLPELTKKLAAALVDEPPITYREGGIFRDDFHPEIAEYRKLAFDAKGTIAAMEARERERTGIPSLKLKYSRVFGYTIEITKAHLGRVPANYIRKQTIANGERFITEELKSFEDKVVTAEHKLRQLEESLFLQLRQQVTDHAPALLSNARLMAEADVLQGFARIAVDRDYRRPEMHDGDQLDITDGRHPVLETLLPTGEFVPNSVALSDEACRTLVITGPNMAGKSTIMRQVALIVLLAHAGSFVPARHAAIPLVDAIYTRIGSQDDLTRGRSTFMVEMSEVARILERGTSRSLVLIDEIGRGTSTYDGLALAWSILEHLHNRVGAKTLFATHFHELTALEKSLPALRNANVLVQKWKHEIVFLHKLGPGVCNQSYGVHVARLAGLPPEVLKRAADILGVLETQSQRGTRMRSKALEIHDNQLAIFEEPASPENQDRLDS